MKQTAQVQVSGTLQVYNLNTFHYQSQHNILYFCCYFYGDVDIIVMDMSNGASFIMKELEVACNTFYRSFMTS